MDFASSFSIFGFSHFVFLSALKIGVMKARIKGTGMIFPTTHKATALNSGILKSDAATSPPRSSRIGTIDIIKTIISLETTPSRLVVNHVIKESVILPFPFFFLF